MAVFQEESVVVGEQAGQQETEETDTQETGEEEITPEEESQEVVVLGSDEEQVCIDLILKKLPRQGLSGLPRVREMSGKHKIFSRSGKSQGILKKCQGILAV